VEKQLVPSNNLLGTTKEIHHGTPTLARYCHVITTVNKPRKPTICDFSDEDIVKPITGLSSHDRPVSWHASEGIWPLCQRRKVLPSPSTMSLRLRTQSVQSLLNALEKRVVAPQQPGIFWMIDGKPLPISGCSKDRQAGYGRAANCKAKGYKIHALVAPDGALAGCAWRP